MDGMELVEGAYTWRRHPEAFRALLILRAFLHMGITHTALGAVLVNYALLIKESNGELHVSVYTRHHQSLSLVHTGGGPGNDAFQLYDRRTGGLSHRKLNVVFESIHEDPLSTEDAFARRVKWLPEINAMVNVPPHHAQSILPVASHLLGALLNDGYVPEQIYPPPVPDGFRIGLLDPDGDCRITLIYTPTPAEKLQ
jgi:hypothetical protein